MAGSNFDNILETSKSLDEIKRSNYLNPLVNKLSNTDVFKHQSDTRFDLGTRLDLLTLVPSGVPKDGSCGGTRTNEFDFSGFGSFTGAGSEFGQRPRTGVSTASGTGRLATAGIRTQTTMLPPPPAHDPPPPDREEVEYNHAFLLLKPGCTNIRVQYLISEILQRNGIKLLKSGLVETQEIMEKQLFRQQYQYMRQFIEEEGEEEVIYNENLYAFPAFPEGGECGGDEGGPGRTGSGDGGGGPVPALSRQSSNMSLMSVESGLSGIRGDTVLPGVTPSRLPFFRLTTAELNFFNDQFHIGWHKCVRHGLLLTPRQCMERWKILPLQLYHLWRTCSQIEVTKGLTVGRIRIDRVCYEYIPPPPEDEKPLPDLAAALTQSVKVNSATQSKLAILQARMSQKPVAGTSTKSSTKESGDTGSVGASSVASSKGKKINVQGSRDILEKKEKPFESEYFYILNGFFPLMQQYFYNGIETEVRNQGYEPLPKKKKEEKDKLPDVYQLKRGDAKLRAKDKKYGLVGGVGGATEKVMGGGKSPVLPAVDESAELVGEEAGGIGGPKKGSATAFPNPFTRPVVPPSEVCANDGAMYYVLEWDSKALVSVPPELWETQDDLRATKAGLSFHFSDRPETAATASSRPVTGSAAYFGEEEELPEPLPVSYKLDWATFKQRVVGCRDPRLAAKGSIRGTLFREQTALGLGRLMPQCDLSGLPPPVPPPPPPDDPDEKPEEKPVYPCVYPNMFDPGVDSLFNGLHCCSSSFEGLVERMNWLRMTDIRQQVKRAKFNEAVRAHRERQAGAGGNATAGEDWAAGAEWAAPGYVDYAAAGTEAAVVPEKGWGAYSGGGDVGDVEPEYQQGAGAYEQEPEEHKWEGGADTDAEAEADPSSPSRNNITRLKATKVTPGSDSWMPGQFKGAVQSLVSLTNTISQKLNPNAAPIALAGPGAPSPEARKRRGNPKKGTGLAHMASDGSGSLLSPSFDRASVATGDSYEDYVDDATLFSDVDLSEYYTDAYQLTRLYKDPLGVQLVEHNGIASSAAACYALPIGEFVCVQCQFGCVYSLLVLSSHSLCLCCAGYIDVLQRSFTNGCRTTPF